MQDDQSSSQMELPPGVFPPMSGYTTGDLLAVASDPVQSYLEANNVDPGLIRETIIALASHLHATFEREDAQYQIATWYQKPYDEPGKRARSIEIISEQFGMLTLRAAADSLKGSPLLGLGKQFYLDFCDKAGRAVKNHILKLNEN